MILISFLLAVHWLTPDVQKDHRYDLRLNVERTDDGNFLFLPKVIDQVTGAVVAAPRLTAAPEIQTHATVTHVETRFAFTATGHADGRAEIAMRVLQQNREIESSVRKFVPRAVALRDLHGFPVSIAFQDTDIKTALREFAHITGWNIAVRPSVKGTISVNLHDVPPADALEAMLKPLNLTCSIEENNVIRIY